MNKKNVILLMILFYVLGAASGFVIKKNSFFEELNPNNAYQSGWDAAQRRLIENNIFQSYDDKTEIKSISGIVEEINSNTIKIQSKLLTALLGPDLDYRFINVNEKTKIIKVTKKSDQEYQNELNEFTKSGGYSTTTNSPNGGLSMYKSEEVALDQIEIGKLITIRSDKNIRDEKHITANEIYFED